MRRRTLLFLLVGLIGLPGCLLGEVNDFVRYDAGRDVFHVLKIYTHIAGRKGSERRHVVDMWKERERLIVLPEPLPIFSREPALLRTTAHEFTPVNLGDPDKTPEGAARTEADLSSIEIRPGQFFLSNEQTLCYHHEVAIPGPIVDAAIGELNRDFVHALREGVSQEQKRRAKGGAGVSWEDVRTRIRKALDGSAEGSGEPVDDNRDPNPLMMLDDASLGRLYEEADRGLQAFSRDGAVLRLSLPLSSRDCEEAKATFDVAMQFVSLMAGTKEFAAQFEHAGTQLAGRALVTAFLKLRGGPLVLENDGGRRIVASVDLGAILEAIDPREHPFAAAQPDEQNNYRKTLALLKKHEIPIADGLTPQQIALEFYGRSFSEGAGSDRTAAPKE
jgi:hypothetical protein